MRVPTHALAVGEMTLIEHLEEDGDKLAAGLLDLVDENLRGEEDAAQSALALKPRISGRRTHERVGLAADELGQLAARLETDVAGRSAN